MNRAAITSSKLRGGFTLIEILMAATAGAVILAAIYGVFSRSVKLRDEATQRAHESQLRARAASVLRNDLRNGFISLSAMQDGSALANSLEGSAQGQGSRYPGSLRLTTTTANGTEEAPIDDVQEVEYSIADDPANPDGGVLVRAVDQELTAALRQTTREEQLLRGVASMEVSFFDGQSWADAWNQASEPTTLPTAVRVIIRMAATGDKKQRTQPPIELLVPWTVQPEI